MKTCSGDDGKGEITASRHSAVKSVKEVYVLIDGEDHVPSLLALHGTELQDVDIWFVPRFKSRITKVRHGHVDTS